MEYKNLTLEEQSILLGLVQSRQITTEDLPTGIWVGLDSMGPARSSITDALFREMPEVLHGFTPTMADFDLGLAVATNGPAKEAYEILNSLNRKLGPRAFGSTEAGGVRVNFVNGLEDKIIAMQKDIDDLGKLEAAAKQDKLMKAMLEDVSSSGPEAPMRTAYKTNIVITLPLSYDTLQKRLELRGINLNDFMPDVNKNNYVSKVLLYAEKVFKEKVQELALTGSIGDIQVKAPNRRIYVPTKHIYDERTGDVMEQTKRGGAIIGSRYVAGNPEEFSLENSIYVADNVTDRNQAEQGMVLGKSERSMIKNGGSQARMAFNVTMNEALPRMEYVEGVKILNLGSGAKALEAIDLLYQKLHPGYKPLAVQRMAA